MSQKSQQAKSKKGFDTSFVQSLQILTAATFNMLTAKSPALACRTFFTCEGLTWPIYLGDGKDWKISFVPRVGSIAVRFFTLTVYNSFKWRPEQVTTLGVHSVLHRLASLNSCQSESEGKVKTSVSRIENLPVPAFVFCFFFPSFECSTIKVPPLQKSVVLSLARAALAVAS